MSSYKYQQGFGNHFVSEAIPGTLPQGQNSPQVPPRELYCEQLSGTAFTAPRAKNQRTWLYRVRPAVGHSRYRDTGLKMGGDWNVPNVEQLRFKPFPIPGKDKPTDFVHGLNAVMGAGDPSTKSGISIYIYTINESMKDSALCNSDGDFLFVPQENAVDIVTELGRMHVAPGEIAVVPRGIRFAVNVTGPTRGYVLEIFDGHFILPDLGPIGANGLANPRDFQSPEAWFEDRDCKFTMYQKFCSSVMAAEYDHSVFDVVAWHGNYVPYKYDLSLFNTINSVSYDHPDPSIYTVLTCQSNAPGTAVADFVIFPPRWLVMEHSFRPPWFHRNCMTEFMGLIRGTYEAKEEGFLPGGASLHSVMAAHGPDVDAWRKATHEDTTKPSKIPETSLAFMFESLYQCKLTAYGNQAQKDDDYVNCWKGYEPLFRKNQANK